MKECPTAQNFPSLTITLVLAVGTTLRLSFIEEIISSAGKINLRNCYLPLLKRVTHPVAVTPDSILRKKALDLDWEILE